MTEEELNLLIELKGSLDRGAASLCCGRTRIMAARGLEAAGLADRGKSYQDYFRITDAGIRAMDEELKRE